MSGDREAHIRVLIVDDHAVVRRGIRSYLEVQEDLEVAAEAANGEEALDRLRLMAAHRELPAVVLLDLLMPKLDGVATTKEIAGLYPDVRVVVLTSFGEMERIHAALAAGAAGYLLKDAEPPDVVAAIRTAARGDVFLHPAIARKLTQEMVSPSTGLNALTLRERNVLALVAKGLSNQEIASNLVISERTARTHVSNVLHKLQLTSRTQAALVAVRQGLVTNEGAGEQH
ncbi:DNA-binding NarL/FixJ family response regulator [Lipingzhangella halophila]|uniref:DNA-binding NarL/FixJ family response regulator n=1 Tax=Lipingzhangella halophila TaxID=1783352 RepID=A0A7W7W1Q4_9ACTN|nr:response regulator transcription factor [Lipingzhangella halophila]MBB4931227.1 DNA-binding NarL/FixJ family response regulator [Lipingzhangella halophila]